MMIIYKVSESVWPSLGAAVPFLRAQRSQAPTEETRAGTNYSIILAAACYVEGFLEAALRALLRERLKSLRRSAQPSDLPSRRTNNTFLNRVEEELDGRIARTVGVERYNELFRLLTGDDLYALAKIRPLWEGLIVLFQFRNVLAHGRELTAQRTLGPDGADERFSGGYKKAETYLLKYKLIPLSTTIVQLLRAAEEQSSPWPKYALLADPIADHFWSVAENVPRSLCESLAGDDQQVCQRTFGPESAPEEVA